MRTLSISKSIYGVFGRIDITDENRKLLFSAEDGKSSIFQSWNLSNEHDVVMSVRKRVQVLRAEWMVSGELGDFSIRKRMFSSHSIFDISSGIYHGAVIDGCFWKDGFRISTPRRVIAHANGQSHDQSGRHNVMVNSNSGDDLLLCSIVMISQLMGGVPSQ